MMYQNTDKSIPESVKYWDKVTPTMNGILGGFSYVHNADIQESKDFLSCHLGESRTTSCPSRVLDCGSGIGRLGQYLLPKFFTTVDLIEPCQHLMQEAVRRIHPDNLGSCMTVTLQNVNIPNEMYDCIVIQWVCMYFTDQELTELLQKCMKGLRKPNGFLFIKENISNKSEGLIDESDSSVTRTSIDLESIIRASGANILNSNSQKYWFPGLLPVRMYIVTP